LFCMPFGVMRFEQFPVVHATERCILWNAQVEQIARATGNSFAITIFAIPFIGPFLGKAFMYLNEIPAFVDTDDQAADYSFKQDPDTNEEWCKEGSKGLRPSWYLVFLWCFSLVKYVLLSLALYLPPRIPLITGVVFVMSLITGSLAKKENKKWRKRAKLLENIRKVNVKRNRLHQLKLRREKDRSNFVKARRGWDDERKREEEAHSTRMAEMAAAKLIYDKVQEFEMNPVENLTFEPIRVESCDEYGRQLDELMIEVVALNSNLRAKTSEKRKEVQFLTKQVSFVLREREEKEKKEAGNRTMANFVSMFMPVGGKPGDGPQVQYEPLHSAIRRKLFQWRMFFTETEDQQRLMQELGKLGKLLPNFNFEKAKKKVKDLEFDVDVEPMKAFNFDVSACFTGFTATIMKPEIDLLKEIMQMAADMVVEVLKLQKRGKDLLPKITKALEEIKPTPQEWAGNEELDAEDTEQTEAKTLCSPLRLQNRQKGGVKKMRDYKDYDFQFPKEELQNRTRINQEKVQEASENIKQLCLNVLILLEAIRAACEEGQRQIQRNLRCPVTVICWPGTSPEFACCPRPPDTEDDMVMITAQPAITQPVQEAANEEAADEESELQAGA